METATGGEGPVSEAAITLPRIRALSGFLITSLLLAEWHGTGRISPTSFWARRARRSLPALVVVLLAVGDSITVFDRVVDGRVVEFGSPRYERLLDQRLATLVAIARRQRAPFAILSLVCLQPTTHVPQPRRAVLADQHRVHVLNRAVRRFAAAHPNGTSFVDLSSRVCPGGRFDPTTRTSDGVHFTAAAGTDVWPWLTRRLEAVLSAR